MEKLVRIMNALREGCPWDKAQTRESLKPYLIEEAYEVIEAIDESKPERVKEELGDLLFQIIFHCRIAEEKGEFSIADVIEAIAGKMIFRHPHVFGDAEYKTADEVAARWEARKKAEGKNRDSILEGVPKTLPSLLRAHRLQDRAAKAGFDWERVEDAITKLDEEVAEFKEALKDGSSSKAEDEFGDILFMLVNISRFAGVNPENALRKTTDKFISRFKHIEAKASQAGRRLEDMTLQEMDALWDEAKESEA